MKMTKKILSIVLVVMMLFSVSMVATSAASSYEVADKGVTEDAINGQVYGYVGDSDMDDKVNVRDATLIQKYAAGLVNLDDTQKLLADVNRDGVINVKDATVIRKVVAGLTVDAPIGQLIYEPKEESTTTTPPEVDDNKIASDFVLHGNFFGDWGDTVLYKKTDNATYARAVIEVAAGEYAFVIHNVKTDEWLKNGGTIDNTCDGWRFGTDKDGDTVFKAAGGVYTFFFDLAALKLTVVTGNVEEMPAAPDTPVDTDTYTIYFTKPDDWANAYIYGFYGVEGGESEGDWPAAYPGAPMEYKEDNEFGQKIYTYKVPKDISYIKFCDGTFVDAENPGENKRTENVPNKDIVDGRHYYIGESTGNNKWAIKWVPDGFNPVPTPGETVKIFFIKPADWAKACVYVMDANGAAYGGYEEFPGNEMALVEGNKYSFDVPTDAGFIKFTDGTTENPVPRTENVLAADIVEGRTYEVDFDRPTEGKEKSWKVKWTDKPVVDDPVVPATDDEATDDEITVYFTNNKGWEKVYIYAFYGEENGGENNVDWTPAYPGAEMNFVEKNGMDQDVYSYKVPADIDFIKFSDGSEANGRTNNIPNEKLADGKGFYLTEETSQGSNKWAVGDYDYNGGSGSGSGGESGNDPIEEEITIFFEKPEDWANAYIYLMDQAEAPFGEATYPGVKMTLVEGSKYTFNVPVGTALIKFCDGTFVDNGDGTTSGDNKRTENVGSSDIVADRLFKVDFDKPTGTNKWDVTWEGKPVPVGNAVYFVNSRKWEEVAAYCFNGEGEVLGGWPGSLMTKTGEQIHGFDIYKAEVVGAPANIIFNNNNKGSQTGDLTYEVGKYFDCASNKWYEKYSDIPVPVEMFRFSLRGEGVSQWNWDPGVEFNDNGDGTGTLVYTLQEGEYKFKIYDNDNAKWLGINGTEAVEDEFTGYTFANDRDENCVLKASGGTYTFKVYVDPEGKVKVDVTAEITNRKSGWSLVGDADVAKALRETGTDGVYSFETTLRPGEYKFNLQDANGDAPVTYGSRASATDKTVDAGVVFTKNNASYQYTFTATGGVYKFTADTTGTNPKVKIELVEAIDFTDGITIYFIKPDTGWAGAYVHIIGSSTVVESYPGYEMTQVEGNKYTYKIPRDAVQIKFTDGSGQGAIPRTANINMSDVVEGRVYSIDLSTGSNNSYKAVW